MVGVLYCSFDSKRRFGVELEVSGHVPLANLKSIVHGADGNRDVKASGVYTQDHNNGFWSIKLDRSCKCPQFPNGWEVASYVCSGVKDIRNIQRVANALRDKGVQVNKNCSVHVHVEAGDFTEEQLSSLLAHWMKMEHVISQMVPTRRIKCAYAKLLNFRHRGRFDRKTTYQPKDFFKMVAPKPYPAHYTGWRPKDRRVALNITNWMESHLHGDMEKKTVELRLPEGTLDPRTISNWIRFIVHFVTICRQRPFPENLKHYDLTDTLRCLGLHAPEGQSAILSKGLYATKVWFLERLLSHGKPRLRKQAKDTLNFISSPYKCYAIVKSPPAQKKSPPTKPIKADALKKGEVAFWMSPGYYDNFNAWI